MNAFDIHQYDQALAATGSRFEHLVDTFEAMQGVMGEAGALLAVLEALRQSERSDIESLLACAIVVMAKKREPQP